MLKDRPTLRKTLAAAGAAIIAAIAMLLFGGDEDKDRQVLDALCRAGLNEIASESGYELCLKEPDPRDAFGTPDEPPGAQAAALSVNTFFRQDRLCPGDGVSGHRIRVFVGSPADRPAVTAAQINLVRRQLGYVERTLRESSKTHAQKLQFYCPDDTTPAIETVAFPAVGSDKSFRFVDYKQGLEAATTISERTIYHAFIFNIGGGIYPFGGQGTTMPCDQVVPGPECLDAPHYSMTNYSNLVTSTAGEIFMHEIGHNLGAVMPSSHHSSGDGWHCTDLVTNDGSFGEMMCYDDNGSGIVGDNTMAKRCEFIPWKDARGAIHKLIPFDCDGDFWDPAFPTTGYFADHWNVARSPYLTSPVRK